MSVLSRVIRKPINFVEHQVSKVKHHIQEEISDKVRKLIIVVGLAFLMLFVILFSSIALAVYFNILVESAVLGYLMVAGIYLLLFIILFLVRKRDYLYQKTKEYADYFMRSMY